VAALVIKESAKTASQRGRNKRCLFSDVAFSNLDALQHAPKITIRTLAKRCGISPSTASRALSGHPNVKADVRERVQTMALKHSYRRNQLVSEVMSQVRGARTQHFVGNLAIVHVPSPEQPGLLPMQRLIISGAEARASELGFQLGVFSLEPGANAHATLARVFRARGIIGVIFLQANSNDITAGFPSENFAIVQIDFDSPTLLQHTISLDHHLTLIGALTRLRGLGYHRLGLFIERYKDDRLINKWSAAFRSFQENQGGIGSIPVLKVDTMNAAAFDQWRESHQPDVVVGHVDRALGWLKRAGLQVPEDIGFFNLNWNERTHPCAGLDLRPEMHGCVAVETLAAHAQRSEQGLPEDPRTVMFNGRWVDGPTLRINPAVNEAAGKP
jgi:LacI family transcriptional regulator